MAPLTGNDVADLHQTCADHEINYFTIDWLPVPYIVDRVSRAVYLNGQLDVAGFFQALGEALVRLVRYLTGDTVVPLRPRLGRRGCDTG